MPERKLTAHETDNLSRIHEAGFRAVILFPTRNGLEHKIFDATEPLRHLLREEEVHDYYTQLRGEAHKRLLPAVILHNSGAYDANVSLYKPKSKNDPRIWPAGLQKFISGGDACGVFVHQKQIHFLNLSSSMLGHELDLDRSSHADVQFFYPTLLKTAAVARELVSRLREISLKGTIPATGFGSSAIGESVEAALGLKRNSRKTPDYKGIELKSGRGSLLGFESRAMLFGCVPDWRLSDLKNVRQFLEKCGYAREGRLRLCCTVNSLKANPQGLLLKVRGRGDREVIEEWSRKHKKAVLVWNLDRLEERLRQKHRETFWIKVRTFERGKTRRIELVSALHTRPPVPGEFPRLVDNGCITIDHEISGGLGSGAKERGPAFKIERHRLGELFRGAPKEYDFAN
jgi:hypothetical protein